MNLNLGLWSAPDWTSTWLRCQRKDKKPATTAQQELAHRDLRLKQDRSKHQCRCHLLWELKYHSTSVNGLSSNQESMISIRSPLRRNWTDCFDTIFLSLEEKMERLDSKFLSRIFFSQFELSPHWSIRPWLSHLQKGRGPEKRVQYCSEPISSETILYLRAIQGDSRENQIVTQRFRRVHLPRWKFPRPARHHRVKIDCWWKRCQKRAAVNPMYAHLREQWQYDVTKPRVAIYKQT